MGRGGTQQAHFFIAGQGQGTVPVQQQHSAVSDHRFAHQIGGGSLGRAVLKVGYEAGRQILRRVAHDGAPLDAQHHVDNGGVVVGDGASDHEKCEEERKYAAENYPYQFAVRFVILGHKYAPLYFRFRRAGVQLRLHASQVSGRTCLCSELFSLKKAAAQFARRPC